MLTNKDIAHLSVIAARFVRLQLKFGIKPSTVADVATIVAAWHTEHEPLALDMLATAEEIDLAHDVGGMMRGDMLMSARYARQYHPTREA